ncbi:hypothetical protein NDU88_006305 [Pleurodeles waltl]|uniref:Prolactin receptor n=1 Tax=Pleurodeles waltl TaxID=8319 RepID=A0AAV7TD43_PLEWA|nr:hypothetical protein NDU88_006305 [Pleurodeles waltl]
MLPENDFGSIARSEPLAAGREPWAAAASTGPPMVTAGYPWGPDGPCAGPVRPVSDPCTGCPSCVAYWNFGGMVEQPKKARSSSLQDDSKAPERINQEAPVQSMTGLAGAEPEGQTLPFDLQPMSETGLGGLPWLKEKGKKSFVSNKTKEGAPSLLFLQLKGINHRNKTRGDRPQ